MFRWFRRQRDVARLVGRTADEWYILHRSQLWHDVACAESLAHAVREITTDADDGTLLVRFADVLVTADSEAARVIAAIQLRIDRSPEAESALIAALQDESEPVRRSAGLSLLALGSVSGLAAVVAGTRHGHAVRTQAAAKLSTMKPAEAIEALPALMVLLQYPRINWRTHFAAISALKTIGDAAIPALVSGLRRGSPQVRKYAANALEEMGKTPELMPRIDEEMRKPM